MSGLVTGNATLSRQAEQRTIATPTSAMRFIASGAQTNKDYGLFEYAIPGNTGGAAPHYHRTFSETFYLLDGELEVLNGTDWVTAGPGDLVYVPRDSVHGFRNSRAEPARFLILFTPGVVAREGYFDAVAARRIAGIELSDAEKDAFAAQFDQYNVHS
jgi:mannose-6-phosphate isomerase-like protein (cupin superfamily)